MFIQHFVQSNVSVDRTRVFKSLLMRHTLLISICIMLRREHTEIVVSEFRKEKIVTGKIMIIYVISISIYLETFRNPNYFNLHPGSRSGPHRSDQWSPLVSTDTTLTPLTHKTDNKIISREIKGRRLYQFRYENCVGNENVQ